MSITEKKKKTNEEQNAKNKEDKRYIMAWVLKFKITEAGYDEIKEVCDYLIKSSNNFYQIMIRNVSEEDLWIQFLYYKKYEENEAPMNFDDIKKILEKFNLKAYAWDIWKHWLSTDDKISDMILIQRELPL